MKIKIQSIAANLLTDSPHAEFGPGAAPSLSILLAVGRDELDVEL